MTMTAAATSRRKMTFEAWAALPEDEPGELLDGELVEEEMPSFVHEVIVGWLISMFRAWIVPRGGLVAGSGVKLQVSARQGRMADLVVYFRRGKVQARGIVTVPPDIAVEVVSPDPKDQKRDRIDKLEEYAAFGVRHYWLVSPELRTVEILELGADKRYVHAQNLSTGTATVIGCEGLTIDLEDLWHEVERAENEEPDTT
jgi:Uma2 family endonuclease